MEKKITGYTTVDISQWHRKEHFEAFQSVAQCTYNQTVQLDITAFLKTVKKNKHKFYPAFIHILARLMNAHPEFALTYINCVALTARFPVFTLYASGSYVVWNCERITISHRKQL